jgi:ribosome-associated translation inhibitor RaiA
VKAQSIEPAARVPGARVHFDVDHEAPGDVAIDVTRTPGTRTTRRQRRFGDLTGAATRETKGAPGYAEELPDLARGLGRHPMRVAHAWAERLADGDLDESLLVYAPDAALHTAGEVLVGPDAIRAHWAASPLLGGPRPAVVRGDEDVIVVSWDGLDDVGAPFVSRIRISHGEIAEQWHGRVWASTEAEEAEGEALPHEISTEGAVDDVHRHRVVDKLREVVRSRDERVLHADIRLEMSADPARERPATARALLDLDGTNVRVHVTDATMDEAVDGLVDRLRRRLDDLARHRDTLRRRGPSSPAGEWRHGDQPTERPPWFPRPPDEREIVRHKSFTTPAATVDEAIFDLEAMDLDFFVFTELATGQDAVVHRAADGGYGLQYLEGAPDERPVVAARVTIDDRPAPTLTPAEARERLDAGHEPFVFHRDPASDRGHALYRRDDGHYGLVTPRDQPASRRGSTRP